MKRLPKGIARIRNIGVIAHIDAGKTTTTERLIYYSGKEHRHGDVDSGNTVTDSDPEEANRGITIYSAATTILWGEATINIIDTPGHVDFTAEVERSLRVLDGAVTVLDGVAGVQAQTETVWRQATKYEVPRLLFINKLDRAGASFEAAIKSVEQKLAGIPIPITEPDVSGPDFLRVLDLLAGEWVSFDPADDGKTVHREAVSADEQARVDRGRERMIERLADAFSSPAIDKLVDAHLGGAPVDLDLLETALREATLAGKVLPTYAGSALRNKGVQPLIDGIVSFLPSPLDRPPEPGIHPKSEEVETRAPDPKAPFSALAFKTVATATVDLTYVRVYSGSLKGRIQLQNPGQKKSERVGPKFYRMHGKTQEDLPELGPGDIAVFTGLKFTVTGDTLCDMNKQILFEAIGFPETVIAMTIEPSSTAERANLEKALARLSRDDPTFRVKEDSETGEMVVSGMGELHLEIIKNRLQRDWNVAARFGRPRVSYRETFLEAINVEHHYEQVISEDRRLEARVALAISPAPGAKLVSVEFDKQVSDAAIPQAMRAVIRESILGRAAGGHLLGYPIIDVAVRVVGGGADGGDPSEAAFSAAASQAFGKAAEALAARQKLALLEPIMRTEVYTPESALGNVINDLGARRAIITDMSGDANLRVVVCKAPLMAMFNYSTDLRSMSGGLATYAMEPLEYAPVPPEIARQMLG